MSADLLASLEQVQAPENFLPWIVAIREDDEDEAAILDSRLSEVAEVGREDGKLIVAAVNAAPQLTAALRAVLSLHQRAHETGPTSCVECNKGRKFVAWPCPTVAAITTALGGDL